MEREGCSRRGDCSANEASAPARHDAQAVPPIDETAKGTNKATISIDRLDDERVRLLASTGC